MTKPSLFKWFKMGPEITRLAILMYVRFLLSLRNVEDLLRERSAKTGCETVRFWWLRFKPLWGPGGRGDRRRPFSGWIWVH